jgi:hypothetical protein
MLTLKERANTLARQSLWGATEAAKLVAMLQGAGIPCVVLKGAPLAILAYQNLRLRHSKDIDLLVSHRAVFHADSALQAAGYRRIRPGPLCDEKFVQKYMRRHSEFEYVHTITGQQLDLHSRLRNNPAFGPMHDAADLQSSLRSVDLGGGLRVPTLDEDEMLAYLCSHGAGHAWYRLKWLADIGALLAKSPDAASRLLETSRCQRTERTAIQALLLCHRFWDTPLPAEMPVADWVARGLVKMPCKAMTFGRGAVEATDRLFGIARIRLSSYFYLFSDNPRVLGQILLHELFSPTDIERLPVPFRIFYPALRLPLFVARLSQSRNAVRRGTSGLSSTQSRGRLDGREMSQQPRMFIISGLVVRSEVELASAIPWTGPERSPDIVIRAGRIPDHLEAPKRRAENWETASGIFILRIPGIAKFLIRDGREVVFDLDPVCDARTVALYLLGTCFAILLHQRGNIVLHASAVTAAGRAMLFCGNSGAGKSTMAALLCRRGYSLLNDDVCNLIPGENDTFEVRPDGRMLKLWDQSLDRLEWKKQTDMQVRNDVEKYFCIPPVNEVAAQPVGAIYILAEPQPDEENSIRRLRALDAMIELKRNAYRPFLVSAMEMEETYFHASAALQRGAGVYFLNRRKDFDDADSLVDLLESHWKSLFGQPSAANMELSHGLDYGRHYLAQ